MNYDKVKELSAYELVKEERLNDLKSEGLILRHKKSENPPRHILLSLFQRFSGFLLSHTRRGCATPTVVVLLYHIFPARRNNFLSE